MTRFEEKLEQVKKLTKEAQKELHEALTPDTYGISEYHKYYIDNLHDFLTELRKFNNLT